MCLCGCAHWPNAQVSSTPLVNWCQTPRPKPSVAPRHQEKRRWVVLQFVSCTTRALPSRVEEKSGRVGLPVLNVLRGDAENPSEPPSEPPLGASPRSLSQGYSASSPHPSAALRFPGSSQSPHPLLSTLLKDLSLRLLWALVPGIRTSQVEANTSPSPGWTWYLELIFYHFLLPVPRLLLSTQMQEMIITDDKNSINTDKAQKGRRFLSFILVPSRTGRNNHNSNNQPGMLIMAGVS